MAHAQANLIPSRFQDPNLPILPPFGGALQTSYACPQCVGIPAQSNTNEHERADEETEGDDTQSESGWSETGSQYSTSSATTTASGDTIVANPTTPRHSDTEGIYDRSVKLTTLEELRGDFESELRNPSPWVLQRIRVLSQATEYGARESVKYWFNDVARSTETLAEDPLQLPPIIQYEGSPFQNPITWQEANALNGEDREEFFGWEVEQKYKKAARLSIAFLFPEARSRGLSVGDKGRIFAVVSNVWSHDPQKAKGLLWVMDKEYLVTREGVEREWANSKSKEFMIYTVLFPPPVVLTH